MKYLQAVNDIKSLKKKSLWVGLVLCEAPACPQQQQSTSVQNQNQQVETEKQTVQLWAQGQPVGLSRGFNVLLGQSWAKANQLLQEPLRSRGTVLYLSQGQELALWWRLQLII